MSDRIVVREYEEIYRGNQTTRSDKVYLSSKAFDNLYYSITDESSHADIDKVLSIHSKNRTPYIKASKYVGTIQTIDGTIIEILPKIYSVPLGTTNLSSASICGIRESREIFLNMLRHFRDENGVSFQTASLDAKRDFPMLEAYISSFLKELEELIIRGIKKDYAQEEELLSCLKGKIVLHKQVIQELKNKTKFVVQHSKYQESIPINRILVSALAKLKQLSRNQSNLQKILILQSLLDGIKPSSNIDGDLMRASKSNRLFSDYRRLIDWCALFLTNKGVVTFSGKFINQSFLFQADKLFESYIAFLAKKYLSKDFNVSVQDHRHYLIENHSGKRLFSLRPDIYLERKDNTRSDLPESVIIDTKWKRIDENNHKGYGIDQDDLYQMFAYGKKYQSSGSIPCMILLYPYCDTFTSSLASFIYDINQGGSSLQVIASSFNLADEANYESMLRELLKNVVNSQSLISNNLPV